MTSYCRTHGAIVQIINSFHLPVENAAESYHRVLAADTNNVIAQQGLNELRAQLAANTDQLLALGELVEVENLMNQAAAVGMSADFISDIRNKLVGEQQRTAQMEESLKQASKLMQLGLLTAPPEENAVAYLRSVQRLDPGNKVAAEQLQIIAHRLANVATEAFQFGLVDSAKQYLDLALTISPENSKWIEQRESWEKNATE